VDEPSFSDLKRTYRDLNLSTSTFHRLVDIVYQHSRIQFGDDKRVLFSNRLRKRIFYLGIESFEDYLTILESHDGESEIEELLDMVSTNHTRFFREESHFSFLENTFIPEVLPKVATSGIPINIWSSACSTGEEPYSIALTLARALRPYPMVKWKVTASDISKRVLETARRGIYRDQILQHIPQDMIKPYIEKGVDDNEGYVRISPEIQSHVVYDRINLFETAFPIPNKQNIIFCRNVMIYFNEKSRLELVRHLSRHLAVGGYLIVGHTESLLGMDHGLNSIQQGVYQLGA